MNELDSTYHQKKFKKMLIITILVFIYIIDDMVNFNSLISNLTDKI